MYITFWYLLRDALKLFLLHLMWQWLDEKLNHSLIVGFRKLSVWKHSEINFPEVRLIKGEQQFLAFSAATRLGFFTSIFQEIMIISNIQCERSSHPQMFFKTTVLKNFANLTGEHLRLGLFLIKLQPSVPGVFLWNLRNVIIIPFLKEHLWWLLLVEISKSNISFRTIATTNWKQVIESKESKVFFHILFREYENEAALKK